MQSCPATAEATTAYLVFTQQAPLQPTVPAVVQPVIMRVHASIAKPQSSQLNVPHRNATVDTTIAAINTCHKWDHAATSLPPVGYTAK